MKTFTPSTNAMTKYLLLFVCTLFVAITGYGQTLTVWPGDANNDSVVNNFDVLSIGQGFNTQGIARNSTSIVWQGDTVQSWPNVLPDSTNFAHLDCDGSGFIDENDLLAVSQNYALTLNNVTDTFPTPSNNSPQFFFSALPDSIYPGDTVTIDVFAGSANNPATFFGVAFTILYDSTLIVPGSFAATPDSLLDSPVNRVLFLTHDHGANGSIGEFDIALSRRKNTGGTSGMNMVLQNERLLTVNFIIEDNLIGAALAGGLTLEITKLRLLDNNFSSIAAHKDEVNIPIAEPVAIAPEPQFEKLRLYPQPATNLIIVDGLPEKGQLTITDLTGKTMAQEGFRSTDKMVIDCGKWAAGLYFLHVETPTGSTVRKFLVD